MPPVEDHEVHEKVRIDIDKPYGCHSRTGLANGYYAPDRVYRADGKTWDNVKVFIKNAMSTSCRSFYLWDTDPRCAGCTADKDIEYRDRMAVL